jgi:hypothetical protein
LIGATTTAATNPDIKVTTKNAIDIAIGQAIIFIAMSLLKNIITIPNKNIDAKTPNPIKRYLAYKSINL